MTTRRTFSLATLATLASGGLTLFAAVSTLHAEDPIHTFTDGSAKLGGAVTNLGDVNGDGIEDWAVQGYEKVFIYSGSTGAKLATQVGIVGESFGADIDALGDVDLDGFPDLLIGAPQHSTIVLGQPQESGAAYVVAGPYGPVLRTHLAVTADEYFGAKVAGVGDLDQDGVPDYMIAAQYADAGAQSGTNEGRVEVRSGSDGAALKVVFGGGPGAYVGASITGLDDLDQDGSPEFAIGASRDMNLAGKRTGVVRVYNGATLGIQATLYGVTEYDLFGSDLDGGADVDGDGVRDLLVAAIAEGSGTVRAYSGVGGALIHLIAGDPSHGGFGVNVKGVGDADGDGRGDFLVAATGSFSFPPLQIPRAHLYSGATAKILRSYEGVDVYDHVGRSAAPAGDVDGDGLADLLIGRPRLGTAGGLGKTEVRRGCGSRVFPYGAGCAGTGGFVPTIGIGPCVIPGHDTTLSIGLGLGGSTALVFVGAGQASAPLAGGCTFLLSQFHPVPIALPLTPGGPGGGGISATLPVPAQLVPPLVVNLQAFVLDPGAPLGAAGTRGLSLQLE